MPKAFEFSKGANDYKNKGKATPMLTQLLLDDVRVLRRGSCFCGVCMHAPVMHGTHSCVRQMQVLQTVGGILTHVHLEDTAWETWKLAFIHLKKCLQQVKKQMVGEGCFFC